jgi:hypothetical protein
MDKDKDGDSIGESSTELSVTWNESQEGLLKAISERANCMRWLHSQCQVHFEYMNFYLTIPNVIISTLNGSFTMSLNSLFPEPEAQRYATTIIGLVSIFSAVLITMNQYVKSQQMMEAHRSAALAYGKMHRMISNELAMRRDQRSNASEFLKGVRAEQDRLENLSPMILPSVISKFNKAFASRDIEKPEIAGDLDQTAVNTDAAKAKSRRSPLGSGSPLAHTIKVIRSAGSTFFGGGAKVAPQDETDVEAALGLVGVGRVESEDHIRLPPVRAEPPQGLSIKVKRDQEQQRR